MTSPELSQEFPINTPPEHVGVYEVLPTEVRRAFSYWTGEYFCIADFSPETAFLNKPYKSRAIYAGLYNRWRGLAKPSEASNV